jgi:hypothetical protein
VTKPIPKDQQKKRGPKPKDGEPSPKPSLKPDEKPVVKIDGEPSVSLKPQNTPLKDLAARIVAERGGDPKLAKEPKAKSDSKPTAAKAPEKKKEMEPVDLETVDALAGAMAAGEAEAAAIAVPSDHADDVRKRSAGILKFAWKYHFIQNGINGFPSWAILLVAHFATLLMILSPNKDRIVSWYNDFTGKVPDPKAKGNDGKVVDEKPKPSVPAPVTALPNAESGELKKPADPNAFGG